MTQIADNRQFMNIGDIARELGISKTTVSRAISGKGRVSPATRAQVLEFIKEHNYRLNVVAKGLAENKTYNIALVVPKSFATLDLPFLRKSMNAVCEVAAEHDYDVLLSINEMGEYLPLQRILDNRKADGVILARTMSDDPMLELLVERQVPFVAMGRLDRPDFFQVDNDQIGACRELTSLLLLKGYRNIALFGGMLRTIVNQSRLEGFTEACSQMGYELPSDHIYLGLETEGQMEVAMADAIRKHVTCFICMDDALCLVALRCLKNSGLRVPEDAKVASFYDSQALVDHTPPVTALQFDAVELGRIACQQLLNRLEGQEVEQNIQLGYQVVLRESTQ